MKKTIQNLALIMSFIFCSMTLQAQKQNVNIEKSSIRWTGKEITTKTHYGSISFQESSLELNNGLASGGQFIVDMTSINCEDLEGGSKQYLEKHLKSEDFFGVEQHATAKLEISSAKQGENGKQIVDGQLTIKGITHPVSFDLAVGETSATANLVFDQSKYNVKFRSKTFFDDLGDKLIYDDIELEVTLIF